MKIKLLPFIPIVYFLLSLVFSKSTYALQCYGTGTYCDSVFESYICQGFFPIKYCPGPGSTDCGSGTACVFERLNCSGENSCNCIILSGYCQPTECNPGDIYWSDTCYDCPDPETCDPSCGRPAEDLPDGICGTHHCDATPPCCTATAPNTPTLVSPANGSSLGNVSSITLDWDLASWGEECTSASTRTFQVCVGTDSLNPCAGDIISVTPETGDTPLSTTVYTQGTANTYFWKVQATNKAGYASTWSSTFSFSISVSPPVVPPGLNAVTPAEIPRNGMSTLFVSPTDANGGSDIQNVLFSFNDCVVNPGDAYWSRFEHENANFFGATWNYLGVLEVATNNFNAGCSGTEGTQNPWSASRTNVPRTMTLSSVTATASGTSLNMGWILNLSNFPVGTYNTYMMVRDKQYLWHTYPDAVTSWTQLNPVCIEGFNSADPKYLSAWTPACGNQIRTCTQDCNAINNCAAYPTSQCTECGPNIGAWTAWQSCNSTTHKRTRTRTCTENCSTDGSQCQSYFAANCPTGSTCVTTGGPLSWTQTETQDCLGTVSGTLYDASDVDNCLDLIPALALNGENTALSFTTPPWPPITSPVLVDINGNYNFTAYSPGSYTPNFQPLMDAGVIGSSTPKLYCPSVSATFTGSLSSCMTQPCETVTAQNYGFWRSYNGWWQAVGAPVYAGASSGDTVQSIIPPSVSTPPASNMYLIKPSTTSNQGFIFTGGTTELGTNPNAKINSNNVSYQGTYEGNVTYNYDFFNAKYSRFTSNTWNTANFPTYNDGGKGYMFIRYTGTLPFNLNTNPNITSGQKIIALVPGNVNINTNVTIANGGFLTLIADGNITFGSTVSAVSGWYVADNQIIVSSTGTPTTEVQFQGNGSFVGHGGISLNRDLGAVNNTTPAELFTYNFSQYLAAPTVIKFPYKKYTPYAP